MTPIDLLRDGIIYKDWTKIHGAYKALTGIELPIPEDEELSLSGIRRIIQEELNTQKSATIPKMAPSPPEMPPKAEIKNSDSNIVLIDDNIAYTKEEIEDLVSAGLKHGVVQNDGTIYRVPILLRTDFNNFNELCDFLESNPNDLKNVVARVNEKSSAKAKTTKKKLSRKPSKTFKVECNECEKTFDSYRKSGDIGQKCSKCLRATKST